jgi:hypothetical protein
MIIIIYFSHISEKQIKKQKKNQCKSGGTGTHVVTDCCNPDGLQAACKSDNGLEGGCSEWNGGVGKIKEAEPEEK